jgi:hypothetical protein
MKKPNLSSNAGNTVVVAMLVIFVITALIAIAANYTQQMSRVSKRSRAIDTAMEIGDGCLETLFTNWRNINRSETSYVLPTNYFYTTVYHPSSQPTATPGVSVPALIPTPAPSNFPSATNYTINTYQIIATDPMLAPASPDTAIAPAGYGPGWIQYSFYYLASADVTVPALGASGTVTSKVRRVFEKKFNTPFTWSIFYNDLLEITPGSGLTLTGAIHTNNSLYTGSSNLTVSNMTQNNVSILGTLGYVGSWTVGYAPGDSYHSATPTAPNYPSGQPPAQENNYLPFGWNTSQVFNVTDQNGNNDGYREIVEMPVTTGSPPPADALSTQRYYNQAYVRIIVDSSGNYKYYDKNGNQCTSSTGNANQKQIFNTFNSALGKDETFTDAREGSTVTVGTLDVSKVTTDVNGGKLSQFNGVVYFSDQRANQTGGTPKYGLRIKNGSSLPTYTQGSSTPGLTVATDNPVYVLGDFNTGTSPPSNNSSNPDPTNPTANNYTRQFAAIIGDSVTLLSNAWQDTHSSNALSGRLASNTTVNAAIVAGDVPTASGNYSGGAENLVRLLEDWTGKRFTYYGSMVEIYHSRQAIGTWGKANVYNPPAQYFYYDANFQSGSPPGNLVFASYLQQQRWYLVY